MKRKAFIRKSLQLAAGLAFVPSVLSEQFNTNAKAQPLKASFKPNPSEWKNDEINIAWIGHATVLINFYGTMIITDPVLFDRVGLYWLGMIIGPSRYTEPALEVDDIPKPDLVLLSHGHMDHTDFKTLTNLTCKYPDQIDCITAFNTKDISGELEWRSIREMDWGDELDLLGIKFKALEVQHFGWRFPWERDRSKGFMWNGRSYNAYLLEKNGKKILFGGDTAFHNKFIEAGITDVDIAIMPIGAYNPWRRNHCNPEEALIMAAEHMNAKYFVPIHCYTFRQGQEPINEPLSWLKNSAPNYPIEIGLNSIGETFTLA